MTTREIAAAPPVPSLETRATHPVWRTVRRWAGGNAWIHAFLLVGVAVCIYPLVWMFFMSVKTDEELGSDETVPSIPAFRDHSPYVRSAPPVTKPADVRAEVFAAALPRLRELATAVALAALPPNTPPSVSPQDWADAAGATLLERLLSQLPRQSWDESVDALVSRCRSLLTPDVVEAVVSSQLARAEIGALMLRTTGGRLFRVASGRDPGEWHLESRAAALVPSGDALRLDYRFASGGDEAITLSRDFDLPDGVSPDDIHKLVLAIRSDDSWHGIDAALDVGGVHWISSRRTYLAQNRAQSISFQPPTFDDTTARPRTWVPLRKDGTSDRLRNARLTLTLRPSSLFTATTAKIARNYVRAFDSGPFLQYVANSLLLVALTTAGALFSSAFVAYAFARLAWPGRAFALVLLLSTMMIPPQVTMIPCFLVWRELGWYNTLNPIWVPAWFGNAFFIFLMVQHMKTIPRELEEAAKIDGLGIVQTWWYIIVPQLKPTLAAIAVLSFLGAWNEFMGPLIYLRDQARFPLSLGLFGMRVDHGADWSMLMAANVLMTIPSILVFFRFQKYFIEGVTVTGMKG